MPVVLCARCAPAVRCVRLICPHPHTVTHCDLMRDCRLLRQETTVHTHTHARRCPHESHPAFSSPLSSSTATSQPASTSKGGGPCGGAPDGARNGVRCEGGMGDARGTWFQFCRAAAVHACVTPIRSRRMVVDMFARELAVTLARASSGAAVGRCVPPSGQQPTRGSLARPRSFSAGR